MKLKLLTSYHANLGKIIDIGCTPFGDRAIVEVNGGEFRGPRLKGHIRKAGVGDWLTIGDTHAHLDIRTTLVTQDGAVIYFEILGKLEMTEAVQKAIAGEVNTDFGEQYFFTTPKMQCGDPRYKWVNNIVCVAEGRLQSGKADFDVYEVTNS